MADTMYVSGVYHKHDGNEEVVGSSGQITVESGGEIEIESGGIIDIETGGALKIGATAYIDTGGKIVEQFESITTAASILKNYGVSYLGGTTDSGIAYYLPAGNVNTRKTIIVKPRTSTGAVVITSSGSQIGMSTDSTGSIITAAEYQEGCIELIAYTSTMWEVVSKTTSLVIS